MESRPGERSEPSADRNTDPNPDGVSGDGRNHCAQHRAQADPPSDAKTNSLVTGFFQFL